MDPNENAFRFWSKPAQSVGPIWFLKHGQTTEPDTVQEENTGEDRFQSNYEIGPIPLPFVHYTLSRSIVFLFFSIDQPVNLIGKIVNRILL